MDAADQPCFEQMSLGVYITQIGKDIASAPNGHNVFPAISF
jgi:hypothetical protein